MEENVLLNGEIPYYPKILVRQTIIDNNHHYKLLSNLRKQYNGKWYIARFVKEYSTSDSNYLISFINNFHKDVYMCQILGKIGPQPDWLNEASELYPLDTLQISETERLSSHIKIVNESEARAFNSMEWDDVFLIGDVPFDGFYYHFDSSNLIDAKPEECSTGLSKSYNVLFMWRHGEWKAITPDPNVMLQTKEFCKKATEKTKRKWNIQ